MRQKLQCLLDMDCVLADFVAAACLGHHRINPYHEIQNLGVWGLDEVWGITRAEFWKPLRGYAFWAGLPKTSEADLIVQLAYDLFGEENTAVATAPVMSDPECFTGKYAWLRAYYPGLEQRIVFAGAKEFLAAPHRVLVDDRDSNLMRFREAGGIGVICPRPWNSVYQEAHSPYAYVAGALNKIHASYR